jgi:DNA-binding PadR family transcriptional regulator
MSDARTTDFCGEAVLGLVIEQPDHRFRLQRRLEARFPSAHFTHSRTYKAVDRLARDGYVCALDGGQDGRGSRGIIYQATPAGVEHFRAWVCAPTSGLVSREELHAKVSLCQPRDLPRVIDVIYTEECAYAAELERIRERMVAEQRSGGPVPLAEREWSELMEDAVVRSEVTQSGNRVAQLEGLRGYLEGLRGEAERRALEEHRYAVAEDRRTG